jgi:hypothetical protein
MVSGVEVSKGELSAKIYETEDVACVTGFAITSLLCWNAGVGATISVDFAIATAAMSDAAASVTATVRVLRSAACAFALVVTPVATVTVHSDPATRVAVAAVRVSVAAVRPELATAPVNVVVPQPAEVVIPAGDAIVKVGSTNAMLSEAARGAFSSNRYDTGVADHVCGVATFNRFTPSTGATVAVDFVIFTAAMFATFPSFSVTAAVRPLQSDA